jgi:hypothetical protein
MKKVVKGKKGLAYSIYPVQNTVRKTGGIFYSPWFMMWAESLRQDSQRGVNLYSFIHDM